MMLAGPARLTDDLWLAAHDNVRSRAHLGEWALGVGLATGLLAELIHDGFLTLNDGELFRTGAAETDDIALQPLLEKMASEERSWQQEPLEQSPSVRARVRAPEAARLSSGWPPETRENLNWPTALQEGWAGSAQDLRGHYPAADQEESRHRLRGHELREWLSYLAYEGRAESRVIDRLSRAGLVRRVEQRRFLRGATVSFEPCDSNTAGTPVTMLTSAVRTRQPLGWSELCFAALLFATGLHHHALATLDPSERSQLALRLKRGLDDATRELLRAADAAVGDAAMR
jgi:hypothetical protein